MLLGHECSGVVVESRADDVSVGDHVILTFVPRCGSCPACASGRPALCREAARANGDGELLRGGRRISRSGVPVNHHLGVSAFADHAVVDRGSVVVISKDVPLDLAALFGCAVLTGAGAVSTLRGCSQARQWPVVGPRRGRYGRRDGCERSERCGGDRD